MAELQRKKEKGRKVRKNMDGIKSSRRRATDLTNVGNRGTLTHGRLEKGNNKALMLKTRKPT